MPSLQNVADRIYTCCRTLIEEVIKLKRFLTRRERFLLGTCSVLIVLFVVLFLYPGIGIKMFSREPLLAEREAMAVLKKPKGPDGNLQGPQMVDEPIDHLAPVSIRVYTPRTDNGVPTAGRLADVYIVVYVTHPAGAEGPICLKMVQTPSYGWLKYLKLSVDGGPELAAICRGPSVIYSEEYLDIPPGQHVRLLVPIWELSYLVPISELSGWRRGEISDNQLFSELSDRNFAGHYKITFTAEGLGEAQAEFRVTGTQQGGQQALQNNKAEAFAKLYENLLGLNKVIEEHGHYGERFITIGEKYTEQELSEYKKSGLAYKARRLDMLEDATINLLKIGKPRQKASYDTLSAWADASKLMTEFWCSDARSVSSMIAWDFGDETPGEELVEATRLEFNAIRAAAGGEYGTVKENFEKIFALHPNRYEYYAAAVKMLAKAPGMQDYIDDLCEKGLRAYVQKTKTGYIMYPVDEVAMMNLIKYYSRDNQEFRALHKSLHDKLDPRYRLR